MPGRSPIVWRMKRKLVSMISAVQLEGESCILTFSKYLNAAHDYGTDSTWRYFAPANRVSVRWSRTRSLISL
jgi:hypothetical protein